MSSHILNTSKANAQRVTFDPMNREHMMAYICIVTHGRQHPTLRFDVPYPFIDVRSMMHAMIGQAHAAQFGPIDREVQRMLGINVDPCDNVRALGSKKVHTPAALAVVPPIVAQLQAIPFKNGI